MSRRARGRSQRSRGARRLLLAVAALLGCADASSGPSARNAVLICLDTVRADSFELAAPEPTDGGPFARALSLERAQSTSSWTLPAVGSVLTGLLPRGHGAGSFPQRVADLRRTFPRRLDPSATTFAEQLQAQGFETVGFVAHPWLQGADLARGFESWSYLARRRQIARAVQRWLDERDPSRRFLLYVHLMDAHSFTHDEAVQESRIAQLSAPHRARILASAPAQICEAPDAAACRRYLAYVSAIRQMRDTVAGMLEALEQHGELERSVVVLFSDHGEEFLEHVEIESRRQLDPRRTYGEGHGHSLFGELLRVPVLVWHPALRGGASQAPASLVDLAPTLLDYLGIAHSGGDGHSLRRALEGEPFEPDRTLYASGVAFGPNWEAVVRGRWKAIGGMDVPPLFYDLERDPGERYPVADPGGMLALLTAYRARPEAPGGSPAVVPRSIEALRALGYLQEADAH